TPNAYSASTRMSDTTDGSGGPAPRSSWSRPEGCKCGDGQGDHPSSTSPLQLKHSQFPRELAIRTRGSLLSQQLSRHTAVRLEWNRTAIDLAPSTIVQDGVAQKDAVAKPKLCKCPRTESIGRVKHECESQHCASRMIDINACSCSHNHYE